MPSSNLGDIIYQSKYYPLTPLHTKRKYFNLKDRYKDSVAALFGKYTMPNRQEKLGILDYATLGIFPLLINNTPTFLQNGIRLLKRSIALILAVPLMIVLLLVMPIIEITSELIVHVL